MGVVASKCCAHDDEQPEQQISAHVRDTVPGIGSMPGLDEPRAVRAQQEAVRQEPEAAATAESQQQDFELSREEGPVSVPPPVKESEPVPSPSREAEPVFYQFTIDRSSGGKLGIDVDHEDNRTLLVENVKEGLVQDWNLAHPELQVTVGDRIVEVNGVKEDVMRMLEECKKPQLLECRVKSLSRRK